MGGEGGSGGFAIRCVFEMRAGQWSLVMILALTYAPCLSFWLDVPAAPSCLSSPVPCPHLQVPTLINQSPLLLLTSFLHLPSPPWPSSPLTCPQLDFDPSSQGEFRVYVINLGLRDGGTYFMRIYARNGAGLEGYR